MYKNITVEAEHNELILENSNGDKVIIPANKRNWVKQKLSEGCHGCIDSLVETLPVASQYAGDGSVYPPNTKVKVNQNNQIKEYDISSPEYKNLYDSGKLMSYDKNTDTYTATPLKEVTITAEAPQWLKDKRQFEKEYTKDKFIDESMPKFSRSMGISSTNMNPNNIAEYDKRINDKVVENIFKRKPTFDNDYSNDRLKTLQGFSQKELELIKNSSYASKIEPSIWSKFEQGLLSVGNVGSPVQFKNPSLSQEEAKKEDNPLNILQPLTIPSKMVQSTYKKDYSFKDAISGKQNNANVGEDLITDPLNLVGLGIWGKLSKANKFAKLEDAYQAVKGLSKEEAISKLSNLPKLEQMPLDYNIEDLIKGISTTDRKNMTIIKEGNKYYKELNNPESLKRLKEFGDEYGIDLLDAYKKAEKRWDYGSNIGKHDKFQVAGDEVFKDDIADAMGVSTYNREGIMKSFLSKDKNLSKTEKDLSNHSVNYINKKADIADYDNIVWHELSHDINKNIIGESPKLQQEIKEIFKNNLDDISENTLKETKEITDKLYKSNIKVQNNSVNKTLKERAIDEVNYVTKPTETWAFLSTNLRQDLKKTGLIKSYNELLTPEILNQAIKNKNTVFSRFEPYIADKDKFIKLFNKMTLSIAPAALYLQSQQNKTEQ